MLYRDLKPENVVIAANGYVKVRRPPALLPSAPPTRPSFLLLLTSSLADWQVVDFGFAKRVFTRTYTVCGTPEYLAPELLMMKGHGHGVDWCALGSVARLRLHDRRGVPARSVREVSGKGQGSVREVSGKCQGSELFPLCDAKGSIRTAGRVG